MIVLLALGIALGILSTERIGLAWGRRHVAGDLEGGRAAMHPIEAAIFSLLSLLVAFAFNGAATRFEQRRSLIAEEANAVGTAYRRLDFLREPAASEVRADMRAYLAARLDAYAALPDLPSAHAALRRSRAHEDRIWARAVPAAREAGDGAPVLLLPALNTMFDLANTRLIATQAHPPLPVFVMLGVLMIASGLPAGYAMARRGGFSALHMGLYAFMLAGAAYVILDLEYPRLGFIRIDDADRNLVRALENMR